MTAKKKTSAVLANASGALRIEYVPVSALAPDPRNARKHSAKQIARLGEIIASFGWSSPIVIDEASMVLAGHARLAAAKGLGMGDVPCVRLGHLTAAQKKALAIADNAMTDASSFDDSILRGVLMELGELNFDLQLTGLEMGTIDFLIDGPSGDAPADPVDNVTLPDAEVEAVSQLGDVWALGEHKLLCGDALASSSYEALLAGEKAAMVISDPPFNVPINGHVSGLGRHKHREFAAASGEMSDAAFCDFLSTFKGR